MSRNRFFFRLKIDLNLIFLNQLKMEDISTKENIIFVDLSYFIFYRYYVTVSNFLIKNINYYPYLTMYLILYVLH